MELANIVILNNSLDLEEEEQKAENFQPKKDTLFLCNRFVLAHWRWLYLNDTDANLYQLPQSVREELKLSPDNSGVWTKCERFM